MNNKLSGVGLSLVCFNLMFQLQCISLIIRNYYIQQRRKIITMPLQIDTYVELEIINEAIGQIIYLLLFIYSSRTYVMDVDKSQITMLPTSPKSVETSQFQKSTFMRTSINQLILGLSVFLFCFFGFVCSFLQFCLIVFQLKLDMSC